MRSALIAGLILGAAIKYVATEQVYKCGEGPHSYIRNSSQFTIYQLVGRRVKVTPDVQITPGTSDHFGWTVNLGNSKLMQEKLDKLRGNGTFETVGAKITLLLKDWRYDGIEITGAVFSNRSAIIEYDNPATINIGEFPIVNLSSVKFCGNEVSVCVNVTGTPRPSTKLRVVEFYNTTVTQIEHDSSFCASIYTSGISKAFTVLLTASNCFGNSNLNASINLRNHVSTFASPCTTMTCTAVDFQYFDCSIRSRSGTQPVSTTSAGWHSPFWSTTGAPYSQTTTPTTADEHTTASTTPNQQQTKRPTTSSQRTTSPTNQHTTNPTTTNQQTTSPVTTKQLTTTPATTNQETTSPATTNQRVQTTTAATTNQQTTPATTNQQTTSPATTNQYVQTITAATTNQQTTTPATTNQRVQTTTAATTNQQTTTPATTNQQTTSPATTNQYGQTTTAATTNQQTTTPATTNQQTSIQTTKNKQTRSPTAPDRRTLTPTSLSSRTTNKQAGTPPIVDQQITIAAKSYQQKSSPATAYQTWKNPTLSNQQTKIPTATYRVSESSSNPASNEAFTPKQDVLSQEFPLYIAIVLIIIALILIIVVVIIIATYRRRKAIKSRAVLQAIYANSSILETRFGLAQDENDSSSDSETSLPPKQEHAENDSLSDSLHEEPAEPFKTFPVVYDDNIAETKLSAFVSEPLCSENCLPEEDSKTNQGQYLNNVLEVQENFTANHATHDVVHTNCVSSSDFSGTANLHFFLPLSDAASRKKTGVADTHNLTFIQ